MQDSNDYPWYEYGPDKGVRDMEIKVIKTDKEGTITSENVTVIGVAQSELKTENLKEFNNFLVTRKEKAIHTKDGNNLVQYLYEDEDDERGTHLSFETFSPTDDGILSQLMEDTKKKIHLFYEIVNDKFGTKYKIKHIELPDGTWSAPKAKEAWKKGNAVNNRALAMQAASNLFMGAGVQTDEKQDNKRLVEIVIETAQELYDWIKAE